MNESEKAQSAYARGTQSFMGLELFVAPGSLVPRAETELVARAAIRELESLGVEQPLVIDVCCGAGNLACAIASHVPKARVWACDLSDDCVALTNKNVAELGLAERVSVRQGDLFQGLPEAELAGKVDLVVCNPPYISTGRLEERTDLTAEPRLAFDGGPYGLSIHQRVTKDALALLKPGGVLAFEFGLGQDRQLRIVIDRARGYDGLAFFENEEGKPRALVVKKKVS